MKFKFILKAIILLFLTTYFSTSSNAQFCAGLTTLTATSGSIADGSGSANYANNTNCTWLIQPTGNPVNITFTMDSMDLSGNTDAVRIYDGTSAAGTLIAIFRGNNLGNAVIANSGSMFIQFTSNGIGNAQGWSSNYTSASSNCQPNTIVTPANGAFTDGTRNGSNYANNTSCEWLIQPPTPGVFVEVDFSRFDVAGGDSLILYDGINASATVLATLSGNTNPGVFRSTGGSLFVRFVTNGIGVANGWRIVYNTQPIPACSGTTVLNSQSGLFNDGSFPFSSYIENSDCSWLIQPPGAITLDLQFNYFNTEANFDFVRVYEGTNNNGVLLGSFSGNTIPPTLTSTTGSMFVEFQTDQAVNSTGWEGSYTSSNTATIAAALDTVYLNAGAGSRNSFPLNANSTWATSDNQPWLISTPINGAGNQTINILALQGNIGPERTAELYINAANGNGGDTVIVIQRSSGRFLDIIEDTLYFAAANAMSQNFSLLANVPWILSSSSSWITLNSSNGSNNSNPQVTVANNLTNQSRMGYVVAVGSQNAGNDTIFVVQDSLTQILSVSPKNITLNATIGSSDSVRVVANIAWILSNPVSWLSTNLTSGNDSATVTFTANSTNLTNADRSTYIYFLTTSGIPIVDSILVTQNFLPQNFSVSTNNLTLTSALGSTDSVTLNTNLNWTASTNVNWLSISPNSGSNSSTVLITANSTTPTTQNRNASVIFSSSNGLYSDTVQVTQLGVLPVLTTSPDTLFFGSDLGETGTINIISTGLWNTRQQGLFSLSRIGGSGNDSVIVTTIAFNHSGSDIVQTLNFNDPIDNLNSTVVLVQRSLVKSLSVNPDSIVFAPLAGESSIISINCNTLWSASTPATWLNLSKNGGNNNDTLTVTATTENRSGNKRTALVTVNVAGGLTETIRVTQFDVTSIYTLFSVDTLTIGSTSSSVADFSVLANGNWSLTESSSWLTLNKRNGTNTEVVTARAGSDNLFGSPRFTIVTASATGSPDRTMVVKQSGAPLEFSFAPDSLIIGADSASFGKLNITSNLAAWSASVSDNWLSVSSTSGSLTGEITVTAVKPNNTGLPRAANVIISAPPFTPLLAKVVQDTVRSIGLNEELLSNQVNVYPNPTRGNVNVVFETTLNIENCTIEVKDVVGKSVSFNIQAIDRKQISIDLDQLLNGMYFIQITVANELITKKILLLR